jgi:hypothetical protein
MWRRKMKSVTLLNTVKAMAQRLWNTTHLLSCFHSYKCSQEREAAKSKFQILMKEEIEHICGTKESFKVSMK